MKALLAVLPGDGIGPEVTAEAVQVLEAIGERFGHEFDFGYGLLGGCAIDATGSALPVETVMLCQASDAVLLGAVGGPKWDNPTAPVRPEQGLLGIRKALGLYANLRPVKLVPALLHASTLKPEVLAGVDLLVVRELTGGIYFGARKEATADDEVAYDTMLYSRPEIERVTRLAAQAARGRRGKLASVDKANVLASSRLWRRVVTELMAADFPDVALEHVLVDAMAMHLIRRPAAYDVVLAENLFGDILTDEASMLAGSMGLLPSASLGEALNPHGRPRGLYEPIHGSAPDIAGQGVANPLATILSVAMLLRHSLGLEAEALAVETAVDAVLAAGLRTPDIVDGAVEVLGTAAMGAAVINRLRENTNN
ncbi:MAG TPA: 3-isopropylmalate dehydrogenase [Anaerolineae bacterium]|nr:3-isopropylmalate dehydrogenase [Anaerolineae bacterium]